MKRVSFVIVLAATALWAAQPTAQTTTPAPKPAAKPAAASGRLVEIVATMTPAGKYAFEPAVINAKPNEALHVRVKSTGTPMPKMAMSHNFVLLKATANVVEFANAAIAAGFPANYLPADKTSIIASTPLAAVGETVEVSFKAPAAGTYPFLCTFPGHATAAGGMKGSLIVK